MSLEKMRAAGKLAAQTLDYITPLIEENITTGELDDLCHKFIIEHGAVPAPLNYRGYPKSTCISINHVICHGIPSYEKKLKKGDIFNIDVTVKLDGWHGDTSRMFCIGNPSIKAKRVMNTAYNAMMAGIEAIKPYGYTGDIGYAIEKEAIKNKMSVVREYTGHGLGQHFHTEPHIFNYGTPGEGDILKPGMFITIEPMVNIGKPHTLLLKDDWTVVTRDKTLSAQWEHTVAITEDGYEILTLSEL